jgi:hypothetical protein
MVPLELQLHMSMKYTCTRPSDLYISIEGSWLSRKKKKDRDRCARICTELHIYMRGTLKKVLQAHRYRAHGHASATASAAAEAGQTPIMHTKTHETRGSTHLHVRMVTPSGNHDIKNIKCKKRPRKCSNK